MASRISSGVWPGVEVAKKINMFGYFAPGTPLKPLANAAIFLSRTIEARSAAVGHQILERVVNRIVFVEGAGFVIALDENRLSGLVENYDPLGILRRFDCAQWLRLRPGGQTAKIFLENRHHFAGLYVAYQRHDHVGRKVIFIEVGLGIGHRE